MIDQPKFGKTPQSKADNAGPNSCMTQFANSFSQHGHVNITSMIRSLQRTEGLTDCFRRGLADCDQRECAWRQYCLESADGFQTLKDP